MRAYIDEHKDRLFPAEIAYNISVIYGVEVRQNGVRKYLQQSRRT